MSRDSAQVQMARSPALGSSPQGATRWVMLAWGVALLAAVLASHLTHQSGWLVAVAGIGVLGAVLPWWRPRVDESSSITPAERIELAALAASDVIAMCDRSGRITWVNDAFLTAVGLSREAALGRVLDEVLEERAPGTSRTPGDGNGAADTTARQRPVHWAKPEGGGRHFDELWTPILSTGGVPDGGVVVLRDISELVHTQAALVESEQLFRSALSTMQEGLVLQLADGSIALANPAAERILGLTEAQLCGRSSMDPRWRCTREDGSEFPGAEHPAMVTLATGQPQTGVRMGVHHPSGDLNWISISSRLVDRDSAGRPNSVVTTFTDITEQCRAMAEVQRLTRAVEQSPVMTIITDADRRIEYVNRAFLAVSGYSREEVLGHHPRLLTSRQTSHATLRSMRAAMEAGQEWRGEVHNVRKDGTLYLAQLAIFPLRDERGRVTHFVGIEQDITAERERERQLELAREGALAAARAKSEFLQNMSHELRTPMNGILGMAELLLETRLDPQQRADLDTLRMSAESLLSVIRQLFEFSRLGEDAAANEAIPFRLRACVHDLASRFTGDAEAKGLHVTIAVDDSVPDGVVGDPGGLRQVLQHLLENAVKFTEQGFVSLRVRTEAEGVDRVRVAFSVQDSGIGIAPDRQRAIFEAFEQGDGSKTRRFGGMGLGLTLASFIVHRLGGQLEVESEIGHGSTFRFSLELSRARIEPVESAGERGIVGAETLVVDGAGGSRSGLLSTLESWGLRVCVVPGPEAAVAAQRRALDSGCPFRFAILDQRGTERDAFVVAERLRSAFADRLPPMLILTAAGQRGDGERCKSLGISAYLASPVDDADLLEALRRLHEPHSDESGERRLITRHVLRETRPPERVLVAEDNPVNRKVATRLLERAGFEVTVAVDGAEAAERYRAEPFDYVLMDIQMPTLNGLDAARAIREQEQRDGKPRCPIIAVTAHALPNDRQECLDAGMDGLVSKPIHAEELLTTMRRLAVQQTPESPNDAPASLQGLIDWADALARMDGDGVVLHELLQLFREDSPNMLERLEGARRSGDAREIERAAHSLKGASATISANSVTRLALQIESAGREGRVADAVEALPTLCQELRRLIGAIESLPPLRKEAA